MEDEMMNDAIRYEARLFCDKFATTPVASCEFEIFESDSLLSRGTSRNLNNAIVSHAQVILPDIANPFVSVEPTQISDEPHFLVHYYSTEKLTKGFQIYFILNKFRLLDWYFR